MEECMEKIAHLKQTIKARDEDIRLAATFGKELLEDKKELTLKIEDLQCKNEILEQEKYSLQTDLEIRNKNIKNQYNELDAQREQIEELTKLSEGLGKENSALYQKYQNSIQENQDFKKTQEDMYLEINALKNKIGLQEEQLRVFQIQAEISLCELSREDNVQLQVDFNSCLVKNKELQDALSAVQYQLNVAKMNEERLIQSIKELQDSINDKDARIAAYSDEIKKAKDEIVCLQTEVETLKFGQVDVNRRGNSVFAELDDRRKYIEKEYKLLQKKYQNMCEMYEENKKQLGRAKGQIAILSSMSSREYHLTYIEKLEEDLSTAKNEVRDLTNKLNKATKSLQEANTERQILPKGDQYDYLRLLLQQSQEKVKTFENELINLRMQNVCDNERLTELKRTLYQTKQSLDAVKLENRELKSKLKENLIQMDTTIQKDIAENPKIEVVPGFVPCLGEKKQAETLVSTQVLENNVIPEELELGMGGFEVVNPCRKSNKFILREFNSVPKDAGDHMQGEERARGENIISSKESTNVNEKKEIKTFNTVHKPRFPVADKKYDSCVYQ